MIAPAGRPADGPQDRQRRTGGDAARTGDDHDRDRRRDVAGHQERQRRRREREVDEIARQAVGGPLDGRARPLGLLHRGSMILPKLVSRPTLRADLQHARFC